LQLVIKTESNAKKMIPVISPVLARIENADVCAFSRIKTTSYTASLRKKWTNHRFMHEKVGGQTTLIDPTLEKVGGQFRASAVYERL